MASNTWGPLSSSAPLDVFKVTDQGGRARSHESTLGGKAAVHGSVAQPNYRFEVVYVLQNCVHNGAVPQRAADRASAPWALRELDLNRSVAGVVVILRCQVDKPI